jgi:hypothetical protein
MSPQDPAQYFDVLYATLHPELLQQKEALRQEVEQIAKGVG